MDIPSSTYFSGFAGLLPLLFVFLWLGIQFLNLRSDTPKVSKRRTIIILAGSILVGAVLWAFILTSPRVPPDSVEPPLTQSRNTSQTEPDDA